MADPEFRSAAEFREVMDRVFTMMSEDPEMGPRLREADVPQRFSFPDVDMVVNIRPAAEGEDGNLHWEWSDDVDWTHRVRMTMDSTTANRYFQGRENAALAEGGRHPAGRRQRQLAARGLCPGADRRAPARPGALAGRDPPGHALRAAGLRLHRGPAVRAGRGDHAPRGRARHGPGAGPH